MSKTRISIVMIIGAFLPLMAGCCSTQSVQPKATNPARKPAIAVELPVIGADAIPGNGSVIEYWPDRKKKSERVYRNGKMTQAIYYASDGTVVYEMAESQVGQK